MLGAANLGELAQNCGFRSGPIQGCTEHGRSRKSAVIPGGIPPLNVAVWPRFPSCLLAPLHDFRLPFLKLRKAAPQFQIVPFTVIIISAQAY